MSKVALVTDSTAYIPDELTRGLAIHVVPLQLVWGDQTYRDGVDISPDEFYTRLPQTHIVPTTSQPSPAAFRTLYEDLLAQGYDVLSVHISSQLSGTLDSAQQAYRGLPPRRIELVDSLSTSLGMGFAILEAARAARQGATLAECRAIVEHALANSRVYFLVSTLEFLRRGGAQAFLGTALNLKPLLSLRDGRVEPVERIRTWNRAKDRLLELFQQEVGTRRPVRIAVLHASAAEEAQEMMERATALFGVSDVRETVLAPVSPVIGTHTGPGTIGLVFTVGL
jgi:DegV family protein with EDD domain